VNAADTRVAVTWWTARIDAGGEMDPDDTYETIREFPNVVAARRWARNFVKAGKADLGAAMVHQQERDFIGQWEDSEPPEEITTRRRK
jgi:hypothetical protein